MDNFTQNLLNKIDSEKLKQKSKLSCKFRRWIEFVFFLLIVLLDSFIFSLIFFYIKEMDFDIIKNTDICLLCFLPYFWIVLFFIGVTIGYFYFYYKLKGYRLNFVFSSVLLLCITSIFGLIISSINGLNEKTDDKLSVYMPYYYDSIPNDNIWDNCGHDCLFGRLKFFNIDRSRSIISFVDDRTDQVFSVLYNGDIRNIYDCDFIINNRYKIMAKKNVNGLYEIINIRSWHKDDCLFKK